MRSVASGISSRSRARPALGDHAARRELVVGHVAARRALHLAARDLDVELALEAEHDVEEVERLGAEVVHQDRVELRPRRRRAERVGDDRAHGLADLCVRQLRGCIAASLIGVSSSRSSSTTRSIGLRAARRRGAGRMPERDRADHPPRLARSRAARGSRPCATIGPAIMHAPSPSACAWSSSAMIAALVEHQLGLHRARGRELRRIAAAGRDQVRDQVGILAVLRHHDRRARRERLVEEVAVVAEVLGVVAARR